MLFYTVFLSACKDPEVIGLEVQPTTDQLIVHESDTASLLTKTIREDTIRGSGVSYQLLGSYTDPVFGRSDASFYAQVYLGSSPVLGSSTDILIPDSLILSLAYLGYYGDTTTTQTVHVYMLDETIGDLTYYTNHNFHYDGFTDLANGFRFKPAPKTSVSVSSATLPGQLRIPLSMTLASQLLSLNGQPPFANNTNWLQFFKGLYVKTDPEFGQGKGAISYFDLYNNPYSKLTLYYKKNSDTTLWYYDFNLSNGVKVNHQEHDYTGSPAGIQLSGSAASDSVNYIQAMGGLKTKITFPYLQHFIDSGNIAVNKAELEITAQAGSIYAPPAKLFLVALDSSGNSTFMTDFFEGPSYFGGSFNSTDQTYRFNIARQLQKILDGRIGDYGFYLLVSGAVIQANRVVIGSGTNMNYPMKLHFFYTKL